MITGYVLTLLLTFTNWSLLDPKQRSYTSASASHQASGSIVRISTDDPAKHLSGLVMRTTPATMRRNLRLNGKTKQIVHSYYLDRGIYTYWRFTGSTGVDRLTFGPQGHIISKRSGGVVDFGKDRAPDRFEFTNRIDVAKCSEKHGVPCHPLNHLQRVVIKNFGPEDQIILQGKVYRHSVVRNGQLPGVPIDRLRVEVMP